MFMCVHAFGNYLFLMRINLVIVYEHCENTKMYTDFSNLWNLYCNCVESKTTSVFGLGFNYDSISHDLYYW